MCRLVAYLGKEILLEDVLVKPVNSIVMQSLNARESSIRTNGDGFGLGWYAPGISLDPAVFLSIFPAWNDRNLLHLTSKIKSPCFFGHIRAANVGGINTYNCHPFLHGRWMLMHNGQIHDFVAIKRYLRRLLDNDIYNWVQGETDSEHLFALFLQLAKGKDISRLSVAVEVLRDTLFEVMTLVKLYGSHGSSYFNIVLTDGEQMIATRCSTGSDTEPESLYYLTGEVFSSAETWQREKKSVEHECVVISSERLTDFKCEWHSVSANHLITVDKTRCLKTHELNI